MKSPPNAIDPARCPLCGQANQCAMDIAARTGETPGPCWCMAADFPPALLDRVPPESRNKACICAACQSE